MIRRKPTSTPAAPVLTEADVAALRERVRVAKSVAALPDRELLDDPQLSPAVAALRERLSVIRQEAALTYAHRAALRDLEDADHAAETDRRGARLLRDRQLATSPAHRAETLDRLQRWVIGLAVPAIAGLGAASTAGVHAFMTTYAGASAWAAWGLEPAIILVVSGVIIARSIMARAGVTMPGVVTWIERGALVTSIVMNAVGAGLAAIVAPIGVALVAIVVERVIDAIATADPEASAPLPVRTPAAPSSVRQAVADRFRQEISGGIADVEQFLAGRAHPGAHPESVPAQTDPADADRETPAEVSVSERPRSDETAERDERALTAQERARLEGRRNRARVAAHLAAHPGAQATEIAAQIGLGVSTVRRILRALKEEA